MKFVFDTNALILHSDLLDLDDEIIIPEIVISELDKLKMGLNDTAYRSRQAIRKLKSKDKIIYDFEFGRSNTLLKSGEYNNDDLILECAKKHNAILVTGDFNLELKAKANSVEVYDTSNIGNDDYTGFVEVKMNDNQLASFYEDTSANGYGLFKNQYLIIRNNYDEVIDCCKWNGSKFTQVSNKNLSTIHFGKFKALDVYQKCAIDSLFSNDVTLLRGKAGSGKSLIALNFAMNQIENGKYSKIVCLVNPVPVRSAQTIGFYKGDKDDKLLQSSIGNILISKLGNRESVEAMIATGRLVLIPMADIRGYDSGNNSILWVTEAQNTSTDLLKLTLQRVADGSKIIIDGDDKTQVDSDAFSGFNNGIRRMSNIFRGTEVYGEMTFSKIYRSKIAEIADSM